MCHKYGQKQGFWGGLGFWKTGGGLGYVWCGGEGYGKVYLKY